MALPTDLDLPLASRLPEVLDLLSTTPSLVLRAEPGAGKTSLVPLALASEGGRKGKILVLEPRRVAAVQAALRGAELWAGPWGGISSGDVGYRVKGEARPGSRVEFLTEGVFVRLIQEDPSLEGVAALVFDEFHERSLQADLGLALALEARKAFRPDLPLVLMSATLEAADLARRVGAATLEVAGRTFPVETRHEALPAGRDLLPAIAQAALDLAREGEGDLLVFLPGVAEIEEVGRRLSDLGAPVRDLDVLPLHASLSLEAQRSAILPGPAGRRRIILSTSLAESSLTVPGVTKVLDSGLSRLTRFEARSGLNRLVTERESQDRADQRRGRAGRVRPGICLRAWGAGEVLPAATAPEILRAELSGLVLEAAAWGAHVPADLPWLDEPPAGAWEAGREVLRDLGDLDARGKITSFGLASLRLGTEPRLAALVLHGRATGRLEEAAGLAALLGEGRAGTADLEEGLRELRRNPGHSARRESGRLAQAARNLPRDLAQSAERAIAIGTTAKASSPGGNASLGSLLAAAFPDRVARRLEGIGEKATFQLAGGRKLSVRGDLAALPWLVAAEADGGREGGKAGEARLFSAAGLTEAEALEVLAPLLTESVELEWAGLVPRARRRSRAGAILLSEGPLGSPGAEDLREGLARRVETEGLGFLPWDEGGAGDLLCRLRWYWSRRTDEVGAPDLSEGALTASVRDWLCPWVTAGGAGQPCLRGQEVAGALLGLLPPGESRRFEAEAPASLELPSGRRARLRYDEIQAGPGGMEVGPTLEARPQDLYGLGSHPKVLGLPILVRLLSPANRPIHATTDLPGFWRGTWAEVRKDLKGRYPKHDWPEDPLAYRRP